MNLSKKLKSKQRMLLITLLVMVGLLLSGCGTRETPKVYRVGLLSGVGAFNSVIDSFKAKMTELGYLEGKKIIYDFQAADGDAKKMSQIAEKFVTDGVDLILTTTTGAAKACRRATAGTDISVVFTIIVDAVGSGLVDNLRQPGGTVTGVSRPDQVFLGKRIEYLKKMSPDVKNLWIIYDPDYPTAGGSIPALRQAASSLGVELIETQVSTAEQLVAELKKRSGRDDAGVDALHIMPDPINSNSAKEIIAFADEYNLPVAGNKPSHARDGALFSYCDDNIETGRLAASLADKLLRGNSTGTTPVLFSEPRLFLNYKTAQRLGLRIEEELLSQATEIFR